MPVTQRALAEGVAMAASIAVTVVAMIHLTVSSASGPATQFHVDLGTDLVAAIEKLSALPDFFYVSLPDGATFREREAADTLTRLHSSGAFTSYNPVDRNNAHDASMGLFIDLVNANVTDLESRRWRYCFAHRQTNGWHSWIEYDNVAIDFSNGLNMVIRTSEYYAYRRFGRITRLTPLRFRAYLELSLFPFVASDDSTHHR